MSGQKKTKLNYLMTHWPNGVLLTTRWLNDRGYYKQLIKKYCDNGWVKKVGNGVYARLDDKVTWQGAVGAIQTQLMLPVHVGGLTALQVYGVRQYVSLNDKNPSFYLYNSTHEKAALPSWLVTHFTNCHMEQKKLFRSSIAIDKKNVGGVELSVSSPERAILEMLALVPNKITLAHPYELMENLDRLRSNVMQSLLESCESIKAKRLFLYLAETCDLSCFDELKLTRINLGSGKRVIGEGGSYNAKWKISLPVTDQLDT